MGVVWASFEKSAIQPGLRYHFPAIGATWREKTIGRN
jgi:hypothetical protein